MTAAGSDGQQEREANWADAVPFAARYETTCDRCGGTIPPGPAECIPTSWPGTSPVAHLAGCWPFERAP